MFGAPRACPHVSSPRPTSSSPPRSAIRGLAFALAPGLLVWALVGLALAAALR